jgi:glutathione-regulated potassium-efflux system ancillary protein KefG
MAEAARSILIQFAHPAIHKSRVNRALLAAAAGAEGVTVNDLYATYPDFLIDVRREQRLLRQHDVIVFQHPFFWYSTPALLKEWLDLVLEFGFAYGTGGTALNGKVMLNAITSGGSEAAYQHDGHNRFEIQELLAPFDQTAHLCGMRYLPPFVVPATFRLGAAEIAEHAACYRRVLEALRRVDLDTLPDPRRLNPLGVEA